MKMRNSLYLSLLFISVGISSPLTQSASADIIDAASSRQRVRSLEKRNTMPWTRGTSQHCVDSTLEAASDLTRSENGPHCWDAHHTELRANAASCASALAKLKAEGEAPVEWNRLGESWLNDDHERVISESSLTPRA